MSKPLIQSLKQIKSYCKGDSDENKQFTKFLKELDSISSENGIKSLNHNQLQQILDYSTQKQHFSDKQYVEFSIQILNQITPYLKYDFPIDFSSFDAFVKHVTMNDVDTDVSSALALISSCIQQRLCYNYCSVFTYLVQFVSKKHSKLTSQQKSQIEECVYMLLLTVFKTPQIEQNVKETFVSYCQTLNCAFEETFDIQLMLIGFFVKMLDSEAEQISIIRNNIYIIQLLSCFSLWSLDQKVIANYKGFFALKMEKKRKTNVNNEANLNGVQLVQLFQPIFQTDSYLITHLIMVYQLVTNYMQTLIKAGEYTKHLKMQSNGVNAIYTYTYGIIKPLMQKLNQNSYYIVSLLIYQLLRTQNQLIKLCNIDALNIEMTIDMIDFYENYFSKLNIQSAQGFELILNQPQKLVQDNFTQYDNIEYLKNISLLEQYIALQLGLQQVYNFNYMYRGYIELLEQNKLIVQEQDKKMRQIIKNNNLIAINDEIISQLQIQQLIQYSQLLKNIEQIMLKCISVDIPQFIVIEIIKSIYTLIYIVEKQENIVVMYQLFTNKKQLNKYNKQQLYVVSPTLQHLLNLPLEYLETNQAKLQAQKEENIGKQSTFSNVLCTILSSQQQIYTLPKQETLSKLIQHAITLFHSNLNCQNVVQNFLNSKTLQDQKLFITALFTEICNESGKQDQFSNQKLILLLVSLKQCLAFDQQNNEEIEFMNIQNNSPDIIIMHKINQFQQLLIHFGKQFSKSLSRCFLKLISSTNTMENRQQALQVIADIQISLIVCANIYELLKLKLIDYSSIKIQSLSQQELFNQYIQNISLVIKYFAIKDKFNKDKSSGCQMMETFNQKISDVYGSDSCFLFRYFCVREPDYNVDTIKQILASDTLFLNVLDYITVNVGKIITFIQENNYLSNENMQGSITCQILYLIGAFDLSNEIFKQSRNQETKQQIEQIINAIVWLVINYMQWFSEDIPSVLLYAMQQLLVFIVGRDLDHTSTKLSPSFPLAYATRMLDYIFKYQKDQQLLCDFLCELGAQDITFCINEMFSRVMETQSLTIKQKIKILKVTVTSACEYCGDNELIMNIKDTLKLILAKEQHRIMVVSIFNAISDQRLTKQANNILSTVNQYNLYMFQFDYNSNDLNKELIQFVQRYGEFVLDKNDQQLARIYLNVILNYSEYYIGQISTLDLTRSDIYDQIKEIEKQIFTQAIKIVLICSNTDQDRYFSKIPEQFGYIYQKYDIFLTIMLDVIYSNNYTSLEFSLQAFGNILLHHFTNHDITKISAQIATVLSPGRDVKQLSIESLQYCLILITQLLLYYKNEGANTKDELQCYFMTIQQVFSLGIFSIKDMSDKQEQHAVNCAICFCTFFVSLQQQKEWIFETLNISIDNVLELAYKMLENVLLLESYINKEVEIQSIMKLSDIFDNKIIQSKRSSVNSNPYGQMLSNMLCVWCAFYGNEAQSMLLKLYKSYINQWHEKEIKDTSVGFRALIESMKSYNIKEHVNINDIDYQCLNKEELQQLNSVFQ